MRFTVIGLLLFLSFPVISQVKISGIVVDSLAFKTLPNVHIKIKNKTGGTVTDTNGFFRITAAPFDTLILSTIGYIPLSFPVLINEEDVIFLMREDVTYLLPVIVTGNPILSPLVQEKKITPYRQPTASKLVSGSGIAFDYFSREQRERRKLQRLIDAQEKVSAYHQLVTDPSFKDQMMQKYRLTEDAYYDAILHFNLTRIDMVEFKTVEEVQKILDDFFCKDSGRCR